MPLIPGACCADSMCTIDVLHLHEVQISQFVTNANDGALVFDVDMVTGPIIGYASGRKPPKRDKVVRHVRRVNGIDKGDRDLLPLDDKNNFDITSSQSVALPYSLNGLAWGGFVRNEI